MQKEIIKSYKAFDMYMKCRGLQYKVGKEYTINNNKIKCCEYGFHACRNPLDTWNYYDILESRFAEVEQSGIIDKLNNDNTTKVCSSHIKIIRELNIDDIINIGIEWLQEHVLPQENNNTKYLQIGSSQLYDRICANTEGARIVSNGTYTQISTSSNCVQIGSTGDYATISSSGHATKLISCGKSAQISISGDSARVKSIGNYARISSSGDYSKIESTGKNAVIVCSGTKNRVKATIGSWITFTEREWNNIEKYYVIKSVKTEIVDGYRIKENTWYYLKDGKFEEALDY